MAAPKEDLLWELATRGFGLRWRVEEYLADPNASKEDFAASYAAWQNVAGTNFTTVDVDYLVFEQIGATSWCARTSTFSYFIERVGGKFQAFRGLSKIVPSEGSLDDAIRLCYFDLRNGGVR